MSCRVCGRKLSPKNEVAGIGPVCAKKELAGRSGGPAGAKINFISAPRTTRNDPRTWLYRADGLRLTIRIYPGKGDERRGDCECKAATLCEHLAAVAAVDKEKFLIMKNAIPSLYRADLLQAAKGSRGNHNTPLETISAETGLSINTIRGFLAGRPGQMAALWTLSQYLRVDWLALHDLEYKIFAADDIATPPAAIGSGTGEK
jgi:hypothetical protein